MKWIMFALALAIAACVPIRPQPSAFTSPMMQPASVLAAPQMQYDYLLPVVSIAPAPVEPALTCGLTPEAQEMARLLVESDWQRRDVMVCDYRLVFAAAARAQDMVDNSYFAHVNPITGETPNEQIKRFGCEHPYGPGNYYESISTGYQTTQAAMDGLIGSETHRIHLAGESPFFLSQTMYGVGYAVSAVHERDNKYVLLIAECES